MGQKTKVLAGALIISVVIVLLLIVIPTLVSENRARTGHHIIDYSIRISSDTVLYNLTLFLPLPAVDGSSQVGEDLVRGSGYNVPAGWKFSMEIIQGSPMLKITTPQLGPERQDYPKPIPEDGEPGGSRLPDGQVIQTIPLATHTISGAGSGNGTAFVRIRYDTETNTTIVTHDAPVIVPVAFGDRINTRRSIDTRSPIGREPLLYPKGPLISADCWSPASATTRCFGYSSLMYIDYTPVESPDITIMVSVSGTNEWWELGWSSNSYTDRITVHPEKGETGWIPAEGVLQTANGRY